MSPEAATQDIMMRRPRADKRAVRLGIVIENGRLIKEKIEARIPVASIVFRIREPYQECQETNGT